MLPKAPAWSPTGGRLGGLADSTITGVDDRGRQNVWKIFVDVHRRHGPGQSPYMSIRALFRKPPKPGQNQHSPHFSTHSVQLQSQTTRVNFLSALVQKGDTRSRIGTLGDKAHGRRIGLPRIPPLLHRKKDQSKLLPALAQAVALARARRRRDSRTAPVAPRQPASLAVWSGWSAAPRYRPACQQSGRHHRTPRAGSAATNDRRACRTPWPCHSDPSEPARAHGCGV